jgi:N-acetylneuraminic acid mutarotase
MVKRIITSTILVLLMMSITCCSKNPVSSEQDLLAPVTQSPANQSTNISLAPLLQWQKVDGATSYSVQISVETAFTKLLFYKQAIATNYYQTPQGLLTGSTRYYWRIRANNGNIVSPWSTTWSFFTNNSPIIPNNPYPTDNAIDMNNSLTLSWTCSDIDPNDTISYDVYLIDFYPPTVKIDSNLITTQCLTGNLKKGVTYYWRVVAKDNYGNLVSSPIWMFTTRGPWVKLSSLMIELRYPGCAFVNNTLFSLGGGYDDGYVTDLVQAYNINSNIWEVAPSIPRYHSRACAVACNNKIYLLGGKSKLVDEFDPNSGSWTIKADMPVPKVDFAAVAIDSMIYVIGGDSTYDYGPSLNSVEVYNTITNSWSSKTNMITPRQGHTACVANGKIYVFGGSDNLYGEVNTVEEYDPSTNTWSPKNSMPTRRMYLSSATVGGLIYVMGGYYNDSYLRQTFLCPEVECFDPLLNSWTSKTLMPQGKMWFGAASDGNYIYTIGGYDLNSHNLDEVYRYDPLLDQ